MERGIASLLVLSILFKLTHPLTGIPLSLSSFLFRSLVAVLFFFYLGWPWLFAPPLQKRMKWDRVLHFSAPILWVYGLLAVFLARIGGTFFESDIAGTFYAITSGILGLFVIALSIHRIHYAESKPATRYYAWILVRCFLIGWLEQMVVGPIPIELP
jgi:hypothetical protein